ncbi:hypothetical protein LA52FAK_18330 [Desulforhopalus sp. 52FAK]
MLIRNIQRWQGYMSALEIKFLSFTIEFREDTYPDLLPFIGGRKFTIFPLSSNIHQFEVYIVEIPGSHPGCMYHYNYY